MRHWLLWRRTADDRIELTAIPYTTALQRRRDLRLAAAHGWAPLFHVADVPGIPPTLPWDWADPRTSFLVHLAFMAVQPSDGYQEQADLLLQAYHAERLVFSRIQLGAA